MRGDVSLTENTGITDADSFKPMLIPLSDGLQQARARKAGIKKEFRNHGSR